jgi:hypothetical protein
MTIERRARGIGPELVGNYGEPGGYRTDGPKIKSYTLKSSRSTGKKCSSRRSYCRLHRGSDRRNSTERVAGKALRRAMGYTCTGAVDWSFLEAGFALCRRKRFSIEEAANRHKRRAPR